MRSNVYERLTVWYVLVAVLGAGYVAYYAISSRATRDFEAISYVNARKHLVGRMVTSLGDQLQALQRDVKNLAKLVPPAGVPLDQDKRSVLEERLAGNVVDDAMLSDDWYLDVVETTPEGGAISLARYPIENYPTQLIDAWPPADSKPPAPRVQANLVNPLPNVVDRSFAAKSVRGAAPIDLVYAPDPNSHLGGVYVHVYLPIEESKAPDGKQRWLSVWKPAELFFSKCEIDVKTGSASFTSNLFILNLDPDWTTNQPKVPRLLWHSEQRVAREWPNAEEARFVDYFRRRIDVSSVESMVVPTEIGDLPSVDGSLGSTRGVYAIGGIDHRNKRRVPDRRLFFGIEETYAHATALGRAQGNVTSLLAGLATGILVVGLALLYFQRQTLRQQARLQRKLEQEELVHDYRELFAENPSAMFVFNEQNRLIDCNRAAERLTGLTIHEMKDRVWSDLFVENKDKSRETTYGQLVAAGNLRAKDRRVTRIHDGSSLLLELWGRRITDFWVIMANDVESRRELEQQLARFKRVDSMGALAASIAHDFNNVLGKVQILVSHARSETESDPDSPLYSDLSQIEDHVDDASRLVSNLLSLKESVIANSATRHVETLRQVASGVKRIVPANVAYDYSIADDLPDVWLTDIALKRIVDNLVKNSLDAMPYGGKLTVTAERRNVETQAGHDALPADEYLVLDVRDTGVGMSPEVLENVFEPFYSTKKEGRGSGLGLWTVYKIVRQAGGYVNVKSKPERGTEISCYLRRSPPPVRQGAG